MVKFIMNFFKKYLNFIAFCLENYLQKSFQKVFFRSLLAFFFFLATIFFYSYSQNNFTNSLKKNSFSNSTNALLNGQSGITNTNNLFNQSSKQEISFTGFYIRTIIILVIGFLALYFGMKFVSKKKKIRIENEAIEVIFEYPLLLNRQIMIVKIFKEYYILGVTNENISLINKIEEQEQIESLLKEQINTKKGKFSFKNILEQMLSSEKAKKQKTKKSNLDNILNLKNRIDKI